MRSNHPLAVAPRRSGGPLAMLVVAVVAGGACSRAEDAAPPGSPVPIIAQGTTAGTDGSPGPPETGRAADRPGADITEAVAAPGRPGAASPPTSLSAALRGVDAIAGGDPQEAACIDDAVVVQVRRQPELAGDADADTEAAGAAAVACLPPAKLAAALTERLAAVDLASDERACVRSLLVDGAARPDLARFVGSLTLGDTEGAAAAAATVDAACGTHLAR
jgi:hypothetical protein